MTSFYAGSSACSHPNPPISSGDTVEPEVTGADCRGRRWRWTYPQHHLAAVLGDLGLVLPIRAGRLVALLSGFLASDREVLPNKERIGCGVPELVHTT
jgi:hypothetical protein